MPKRGRLSPKLEQGAAKSFDSLAELMADLNAED
jgi:hypothetical protein